MDRSILEALERLKQSLASAGVAVKRFVVFGSTVAGNRTADSDIDVAAISDDFAKMNLYERLATCGRALVEAGVSLPLEVLPYTEREYDDAGRGTFLGDEVKPNGVEVT